MEVSDTMGEVSKKRIQKVEGRIVVNPPEDVTEDTLKGAMIYRCKWVIDNKIINTPMEEYLSVLNPWITNMTFFSGGVQFGILVLQFKKEEKIAVEMAAISYGKTIGKSGEKLFLYTYI